jgi:membrane associated rhomboid family serine protease
MFFQLPTKPKRFVPMATVVLGSALLLLGVFALSATSDERLALFARFGVVTISPDAGIGPFLFDSLPRTVTSLFMHGSFAHLAGNLVFFLALAFHAEQALGKWRFATAFLLGGALSNLVTALLFSGNDVLMVGASGAVSAIAGIYFVLFPFRKLGLIVPLGLYVQFVRLPVLAVLGVWYLLQLVYTFFGPTLGGVAWASHAAGFSLGALFAWWIRPKLRIRAL